jgi:molybdate transport system ATP-binding protein
VLPYLERLRDRFRIPIVYVSHQFEEVLRLATHVVLLENGSVSTQGDVASVSRSGALHALLGPDAAGAVVEGEIEALEPPGIASVRIGEGLISVPARRAAVGRRVRVQVRASEVVLATEPPRGLAQANLLEGRIAALVPEATGSQLVEVDVGGPRLLSRASAERARELRLSVGQKVWLVVSSAAVRGDFPAA